MLKQPQKTYKQVFLVRLDLTMRKGKIAAQVAHASMGAFLKEFNYSKLICGAPNCDLPKGHSGFLLDSKSDSELHKYMASGEIPHSFFSWLEDGHAKIVLGVDSEQLLLDAETLAEKAALPYYLVTDSGRTEFGGVPTRTVLCIGPALSDEIDKITGTAGLIKTKLI